MVLLKRSNLNFSTNSEISLVEIEDVLELSSLPRLGGLLFASPVTGKLKMSTTINKTLPPRIYGQATTPVELVPAQYEVLAFVQAQ